MANLLEPTRVAAKMTNRQTQQQQLTRLFILLVVVVTFMPAVTIVNCLSSEIRIGALLGPEERQQDFFLKAAINSINANFAMLPPQSKLVARIENVSLDDALEVDRKACSILKSGVVAMLGPMDGGAASQHVQAICDSLEVPHIETQPNLALHKIDLAINLYPSHEVLTRAYMDLIQAWNWTSFAIVYESSDAMIRLQDFFRELGGLKSRKWAVKLFQLGPGDKYRDIFWKVKKSAENNIVLDVGRDHLHECLKQAQQVGLMTEKQNYLITSLDLQAIDLEDFKYGSTKITAYQLVDFKNKQLDAILKSLNKDPEIIKRFSSVNQSLLPLSSSSSTQNNHRQLNSAKHFQPTDIFVQTALIYDAIQLLISSIKELDAGQSIDSQPLSCDNIGETWQYGSSIINYMRSMTIQGLTGTVAFDQTGTRSNIKLNVVSLTQNGLESIGTWYEIANKSLQIDPLVFNKFFVIETDAVDTLVVTAKRTQPYFMLRATSNKQEGNDQYEGYAVDLIHELSRIIGFKYRLKEVDDGKYGVEDKHPNGTKYWNGMIGELVSSKADLAISDLTITASREEAVDFTLPFMNTGISILFKKPANKVTTLFSFLSPFSFDVWLYVLCAYTGVSLEMFFVGRLSPYEWTNPYPCRKTETVLTNSFSVLNSFWFTIGSLMQQGSDLAPKSMSTRAMAGIWYFFTLIMISSYTANLAAFLTVEKVVYPIENAKDLSEQTEIKYGSVESGTTRTFFKTSQIDTYRKIFKFMEEHKTYVKSNEEGKDKVEQGNFAFFMESTSVEYITERNCNLTQIGSLLDSKGYGIATSKTPRYKRPYRDLLSSGILHLQETGMLHVLKNRWWKEKHGVGSCSDDSKGGGVTELSLANVGGVFVVLLGGMGIAFVIAIFESFAYRVSAKRRMNRDTMCDQMMKDLVFALSCQSSTKPARRRRKSTSESSTID